MCKLGELIMRQCFEGINHPITSSHYVQLIHSRTSIECETRDVITTLQIHVLCVSTSCCWCNPKHVSCTHAVCGLVSRQNVAIENELGSHIQPLIKSSVTRQLKQP